MMGENVSGMQHSLSGIQRPVLLSMELVARHAGSFFEF
jgi:hypothetical protein